MNGTLKEKLYRIIFESDTKPGKAFDIILLILILASVLFVMLESVVSINAKYGKFLYGAEWLITIMFTLEYMLRIGITRRPVRYIFSFYGIIDLLAIIPTYLGLIFIGAQSLAIIRALRLLRVFRILKLNRYTSAGTTIMRALKASRAKIFVFLFAFMVIIFVIGTLMYLIEGKENGFTSIPRSIYWAVVTLTTVGYGDIAPTTVLGQFIASIVMVLGYAIIAVPTGIVTAEMSTVKKEIKSVSGICPKCHFRMKEDHPKYCSNCGNKL